MKESLDLINSNKIYKKIFLEVYSKYKKYGKNTPAAGTGKKAENTR